MALSIFTFCHDSSHLTPFRLVILSSIINSPQAMTVVAGHVNIISPDVTHRHVTEIIMHPANNYIYENDIALLRLQEDAKVSATVRPLCLGNKVKVRSPKTPCYVAGWGVRDDIGKSILLVR